MESRPRFDDLPPVKGMPHGCAWGHFDRDGKRDQLGTLNYLTPEVVKAAVASEVKTGRRIQLDWPLNNVQFPSFGRKPLSKKIIDLQELAGVYATDDELHINTQAGSQWDGFCHVAHQETATYYNGLKHADILSGQAERDGNNGIDNWCKAGGIVGRGVLLDWVRWHEQTKPDTPLPNPWDHHGIPTDELEAVAQFQGVEFKPADILVVRTGFVRWHNGAGTDERRRHTEQNQTYLGVQGSVDTARWIWDHGFSAVAGDAVGWEKWPAGKGEGERLRAFLSTASSLPHIYLISGFVLSPRIFAVLLGHPDWRNVSCALANLNAGAGGRADQDFGHSG